MVLGLTQDTAAMIIVIITIMVIILTTAIITMMQINLILSDICEIELIGIILQNRQTHCHKRYLLTTPTKLFSFGHFERLNCARIFS